MRSKKFWRSALAVAAAAAIPCTTRAATQYWDSNGAIAGAGTTPTGTWGSSNFWSTSSTGTAATGAWTGGNTAVFSAATDATGTYTVSVSGNQLAAGVNIEEGTVTFSSGILTLNGAAAIDVASGLTATINSAISGTAGLTKTGTGTLVLGGSNIFTGTVNVNAGTLQVNADSRLGNASNGVTINGATLVFNGGISSSRVFTMGASGGTINVASAFVSTISTGLAANANTFTYDGPGTLALSAASTRSGTTNIQSGTLRLTNASAVGSGTVNVNSGAVLELAANGFLMPLNLADLGTIRGAGAGGQYTGTITAAGSAGSLFLEHGGTSLTIGAYAGGSGSNTVVGGGGSGQVILPNANTYAGSWEISDGTLRVGNPTALGSGTSAVVLSNGGILELSATLARPVTLNNGTALNAFGAGTATEPVTVAPGAGVELGGTNATSLTISGYAGGTGSTTGVGGGVVILPNANTYAGSWDLGGGTLRVGNSTALGTGTSAVLVRAGGILELTNVTLARPVTLTADATLRTFNATATTTEPITIPQLAFVTLGGSKTDSLTIGDSPNDLTGGDLPGGGTANITVQTSLTGKVVLNQPSDYIGSWSIVSNSTLEIDADDRLGAENRTVLLNGGRLRVTGTFSSARPITTSNTTLSFGTIDVSDGKTLTLNTGVAGGTNTLVKDGNGTLALAASSARSGGTSVIAGTLRLQHPSAAGTGGISTLATLEIDNVSISNSVILLNFGTLLGTGTASATGFVSVQGSNSIVNLATGTSASDVLTLAGANSIFGGGASSSITVFGSGTVALSSPSTYTGEWDLESGTLQIAADDRLGNAANQLFFTGGTLRTTGAVNSARTIFVESGGGTINTNGFDSTFGDVTDDVGTLVKSGGGKLTANHVRTGGLTIHAGTLAIAPNGAAPGTSLLNTLTIDGGGKFDLTNNKLIVAGGNVAAVSASIGSGRNGGGWTGSGIITSQTQATTGNFTSIGIATASQAKGIAQTATALFSGQTVTGSDVLVMYTYGGDANLDGKINVDDYGHIDSSIPIGLSGWFNGDFNYDGKINVDDYGIIDFNIGIQGPPFATAGTQALGGVGSVPEPAGIGISALVSAAVIGCRRRRQCNTL